LVSAQFVKASIVYSLIFLLPILAFGQTERKCKANVNETDFPSTTKSDDSGQQLFIPIVVHIVFKNSSQNLPDEQIRSQVSVLNEDFNKNNADTINTLEVFKAHAGNAKITFSLATQDEYGNHSTGITRTSTQHAPFFNDDIHYNNTGGKDAWPTSRYLNIWVCDLADGVFGYASQPKSAPLTDGAVIDYRFFGTKGGVSAPFDKGRTTTHEIGHWLGLQHLWGNAGGCSDDDGIDDTPMQFGPTGSCNLTRVSCNNHNLVQNFMDQTPDNCQNIFTKGQVREMRNNLLTLRPEVILPEVVTNVKQQPVLQVNSLSDSQFEITSESSIGKVVLIDVSGRPINTFFPNDSATKFVIELPILASGFYFLLVNVGSRSVVRKILVTH
jgi:hypothetical protein